MFLNGNNPIFLLLSYVSMVYRVFTWQDEKGVWHVSEKDNAENKHDTIASMIDEGDF